MDIADSQRSNNQFERADARVSNDSRAIGSQSPDESRPTWSLVAPILFLPYGKYASVECIKSPSPKTSSDLPLEPICLPDLEDPRDLPISLPDLSSAPPFIRTPLIIPQTPFNNPWALVALRPQDNNKDLQIYATIKSWQKEIDDADYSETTSDNLPSDVSTIECQSRDEAPLDDFESQRDEIKKEKRRLRVCRRLRILRRKASRACARVKQERVREPKERNASKRRVAFREMIDAAKSVEARLVFLDRPKRNWIIALIGALIVCPPLGALACVYFARVFTSIARDDVQSATQNLEETRKTLRSVTILVIVAMCFFLARLAVVVYL